MSSIGPSRPGRRAFYSMRLAGACALLLALASCTSTPVTGRRGINFFSRDDDIQLGAEAYQQAMQGQKLVTSGPQLEMVKRCVSRIVAVCDEPDFPWEVNLIDAPEVVNATAWPGGKVAVYTGILPVCETETGLAVVIGHEIAHAVARHGTERVSRQSGVDVLISEFAGDYAGLAQELSGLVVGLPWSRSFETEADEIGLIYMARAGYDPQESVRFWKRMDELSSGAPPEFLSTHPAHATRVSNLKEWMPRARKEYKAAIAGQ